MADPRVNEIVEGLGEAADQAGRRDSQVLVGALRAHRDAASGSAAVPPEDRQRTAELMAEARHRSQEIRDGAARRTSRPIPWWLWLAWAAAIALFAAAWWRFAS